MLPPKGTPIGLGFTSDETYGFPVLTKISPTSPLLTQIPMDLHRNCWILAINSKRNGYIEPITAQFCFDEIERCQASRRETEIELSFHRKPKAVPTEMYQTYRMMSDQANPVPPIIRHIAALPTKPIAGKSIWECLDSKLREHWQAGLYHQYAKNADGKLLSRPIPIEHKPPDAKLYQSVIASRIKEKGKNLYKFETRHCVNGGPMEQGKDFDFSHSPTIGYCPLCIVLAYTAATR